MVWQIPPSIRACSKVKEPYPNPAHSQHLP
jgi:hypothetical protein